MFVLVALGGITRDVSFAANTRYDRDDSVTETRSRASKRDRELVDRETVPRYAPRIRNRGARSRSLDYRSFSYRLVGRVAKLSLESSTAPETRAPSFRSDR